MWREMHVIASVVAENVQEPTTHTVRTILYFASRSLPVSIARANGITVIATGSVSIAIVEISACCSVV